MGALATLWTSALITLFRLVKLVFLAPFILILCPAVFCYEYLVCQSPQLVDDIQHIPRPLIKTVKYSLYGLLLVILLGPLWIVTIPLVPFLALGFASVWLLKSRIPKLEQRSFRGLVLFNKYFAGGIALLIFIPILAFVIFPVIVFSVLFRLAVWDIVFYEYVPAWNLRWNKQAYKPLDVTKREIRVIEVLPGSKTDPLQCRLVIGQYDATEYDALSYAWGGHFILRRKILLNRRTFFVTETVFQALRELRLAEQKRVLWIDAVCIHQADLIERREQVQQMRQIYENARRVVVWLGRAPKGVDAELRQLRSSKDDATTNDAPSYEMPNSVLLNITSRKWWNRVWVLQEIVCAVEATVRVGGFETSWQTMSDAILAREGDLDSKTDVSKDVFEFIRVVQDLKSTGADPQFGLLQLAESFRHRQATDQRDKLYALLGLLNDPNHINIIQPDYQRPYASVFAQFTVKCVMEYKSLGILALAEQHPLSSTSWAVDWSSQNIRYRIPFWSGEILKSHISNGAYWADGGKDPVVEYGVDTSGSVYLRGFDLDVVEKVGPFVKREWEQKLTEDVILALETDAWIRLAGGPWPAGSEEGKAFRRTVTADPYLDVMVRSHPVLEDQRTYTDQMLISRSPPWSKEAHVTRPIEAYETMPNSSPDTGVDALISTEEKMKFSCRRRQFFTMSSGRFGLGPIGIQPGDKVVVLFGSRVPLILRKKRAGTFYRVGSWMHERKMPAAGEDVFEFVGQAFVDGMMEYQGDVESDILKGIVKTRRYHLI